MSIRTSNIKQIALCALAVLLLGFAGACARQPEAPAVKQIPAGKEFSGFLTDYSKLTPSPTFENTLVFVNHDPAKNIHRYVAVIVEPVQVYVASNADPKAIPDKGRAALADYFQVAITNAVGDAFPVVKEPGPLVLRLRTAIIGVDVGAAGASGQAAGEGALERPVNIGKVGVEMEMVDSETGEVIVAAVDRQNLGEGAEVGSATFTREEKFRAATEAFDGWAARLRAFLDSAQELSPEESERADKSYHPYGGTK